jgi:type IV secretion system protein VirB5
MTRTMIAAAVLASVTGGYAHAQVPVTDAGTIAQEVISVGQQAKQYALQGEQYLNEMKQTAQMIQQYYAFVQNPSLGAAGALINQTGLGNDLPINPSSLAGLTSGYSMSLSGLAGKLQTLSNLANISYDQNHVYDCADQSWACQQQKQRAYGLAGVSGIAQSAYQDLRNHMPVVQALQQRAATATTPAEREEVANALQAESVWNQNLHAQVQAAQMQANADTASLVQRDNEGLSKNINDTLASIPGN